MNVLLPLLISVLMALPSDTSIINKHQDGIDVEVTLEPIDFLVGDTVYLEIKATTSESVQLKFNSNETLSTFTIIDSKELLDIPSEQGRSWNWSMQLDTFDATTTSLDGIVLDWTTISGEEGSITIDPIPVTVNSTVDGDINKMSIRPIKGGVPLITKNSIVPITISSIAFTFLCWLLFQFSKNHKQILSPHDRAMLDIECLKNTHFEVHSFYTSLSDIVRQYLEGQFNIAAIGQTTREFLNAAKQNVHLEHSDRESLGSFLVAADLVKFARHEPNNQINNEAIERAVYFIAETSKVEA